MEADTALPTLYAAKKYIMPHLAKACVEYLETNIDASNACLLLSQSRIFEEPHLEKRCLGVIDSTTETAVDSDSFTEIDNKTLHQILSRDNLRAKETVIFAAAARWAEAECTRQGRDVNPEQCREVLGDAMYLIRFPTMTEREFANCVVQSGLLSKQEIIDVFLIFSADNKPKVQFPATHRVGYKITACRRFQAVKTGWLLSSGKRNSIQFSVERVISVVGFGVYGCNSSADYQISIRLEHTDGTVLYEARHNVSDDGSSKTTQVLFARPVQIKAYTCYTASFVEGYNGHGYYGTSGLNHVRCGNTYFNFAKSFHKSNPTDVSQGQIPEILFFCWSCMPLITCHSISSDVIDYIVTSVYCYAWLCIFQARLPKSDCSFPSCVPGIYDSMYVDMFEDQRKPESWWTLRGHSVPIICACQMD